MTMNLKKIGQILHIGPNERAIGKVKVVPNLGATVYDHRKKPLGTVVDIFGPVKSPYVEIEVTGYNPKKVVNFPLYISPNPRRFKKRRRK